MITHYKLVSVSCFSAGDYEAQVQKYDETDERIGSAVLLELTLADALRYLPEVGKPIGIELIPQLSEAA